MFILFSQKDSMSKSTWTKTEQSSEQNTWDLRKVQSKVFILGTKTWEFYYQQHNMVYIMYKNTNYTNVTHFIIKKIKQGLDKIKVVKRTDKFITDSFF